MNQLEQTIIEQHNEIVGLRVENAKFIEALNRMSCDCGYYDSREIPPKTKHHTDCNKQIVKSVLEETKKLRPSKT